MQELYYDKYLLQFVEKKDEEDTIHQDRYVKYISDEGSGNLYEKHFVKDIQHQDGNIAKYITFKYTLEDREDPLLLDKKRVEFFNKSGYTDYDKNAKLYYTVEMCIPESHFNDILAQIHKYTDALKKDEKKFLRNRTTHTEFKKQKERV